MGLTASLDMGSEKMVLALAAVDNAGCQLTGIRTVASQGMERGIIKDKDKVYTCIHSLLTELVKDRPVDLLNVALSGKALKVYERRISVPLQKKVVEPADLLRAEQRCADSLESEREEIVDIIPVGYVIDNGESITDPVGKAGRYLKVTYLMYVANDDYLTGVRQLFDGSGIGEIRFYPPLRAYAEALEAARSEHDFVVVDLGAMGMNVALFSDGLPEYETWLPLGMRTIDRDMMTAFALTAVQARKLKHEYGQALRSACKNKKLQIPDTRLTLESRDLATVIQSRAEELLEGVVYQLQCWEFNHPEDEILLTGGGSRLLDIDLLLQRFSGHEVRKAVARNVRTNREDVLRTPEYIVALGLLSCKAEEQQEQSSGFLGKLKGLFGM